MTFLTRTIFLGISSIAILIKQFLMAQNLGVEFFGIYSTVFLTVALFQQLGGFGTQVYYSSLLVKLDDNEKDENTNLLDLALIPFLLTLPFLLIITKIYLVSNILALLGSAIAILNCMFIIQTTRYYIFDNHKYCKIIALKGILALLPTFISFIVPNLIFMLILDLLIMMILVNRYYTRVNLLSVTFEHFQEYLKNLFLRYTPAIFLAGLYTYLVKIYVSISFSSEVIGVFFFSQILIMIAQNIQYILSVLIAPMVRRFRSILQNDTTLYILSYGACILVNSMIFAVIYFPVSLIVHRTPEYAAAIPLLLPTILVAIIRASDLLSIVNMLMDRPVFASIQQGTSIAMLMLFIYYFDMTGMDSIAAVKNLLFLEFFSLTIGQLVCFLSLMFCLRKMSLAVK